VAVGKSTILLVFQGLKKQRSAGFGLLNTASPRRNSEKDAQKALGEENESNQIVISKRISRQ
jgi:hypothetical protein